MTYRTKPLDANNRRTTPSKTGLMCVKCMRDLKPGQPCRMVHVVEGGACVLHPGDEGLYDNPAADLGYFEIGLDCARTLGLEWSTAVDPS